MKMLFDTIQAVLEEMRILKKEIKQVKTSRVDEFKETWIDAQDVKHMLHISDRTLQRLRDSRTLPFSRINGKLFYKLSDVESLLERNYSSNQKDRCRGCK